MILKKVLFWVNAPAQLASIASNFKTITLSLPLQKSLFSRFNTYFQFLIVKVIFLKSIFKRLLQKSMIQSQNLKILKFVNASKYVTQSCPEPSVRSPTDQAKKVEKASHCTCCGSNRCPIDQ